MNRLIQLLLIVLLTFTISSDANAHCGSCAGDEQGENHSHEEKVEGAEKAGDCGCKKAKDGAATWCDSCKVGKHDGKKYKCQDCFNKATGKSDKECAVDACVDKKKDKKEG